MAVYSKKKFRKVGSVMGKLDGKVVVVTGSVSVVFLVLTLLVRTTVRSKSIRLEAQEGVVVSELVLKPGTKKTFSGG